MSPPTIGIVFGSKSDFEPAGLEDMTELLKELGVGYDVVVRSAHRNPDELTEWILRADDRDYTAIIAAAGMSAALPGVVAAQTMTPVIGVGFTSNPDPSGRAALGSMIAMPPGVPVAVTGLGKAAFTNAVHHALRIASLRDDDVGHRYGSWLHVNTKPPQDIDEYTPEEVTAP